MLCSARLDPPVHQGHVQVCHQQLADALVEAGLESLGAQEGRACRDQRIRLTHEEATFFLVCLLCDEAEKLRADARPAAAG